jgi:hypothetical protein
MILVEISGIPIGLQPTLDTDRAGGINPHCGKGGFHIELAVVAMTYATEG